MVAARSSAAEIDNVETEVEFKLANLADRKQGYWVDFRYRFWPDFLNKTILGDHFSNPQLIATLRTEQVWFNDLLNAIAFTDGSLTEFKSANRLLSRFTVGLTYQPVPLIAFQLAYEYSRTKPRQEPFKCDELSARKERRIFPERHAHRAHVRILTMNLFGEWFWLVFLFLQRGVPFLASVPEGIFLKEEEAPKSVSLKLTLSNAQSFAPTRIKG